MARIGLLTGGGDCPGLNAAIRAVVRQGVEVRGHTIVAFRDGWRGVIDGHATELDVDDVRGLLPRGGTILGTSGTNPLNVEGGHEAVRETMRTHGLEGLIVIGGEGTLGAAAKMPDVPVVGVPKTIDNDIIGTDFSIGFSTALQIATDAIDRVHTTAESHNRVMLVEVMGRSAGWIGTYAGLAGGADVILIPEHPFDVDAVTRHLRRRHLERSSFSIVVIAEGAMPVEGTMRVPDYPLDENGFPKLGGISNLIADEISDRTGYQTRAIILGHVQRGGSPSAYDRILATQLGVAAIERATAGGWGALMGLRGTEIVPSPLEDVPAGHHQVPWERYVAPPVSFG